MVCSKRHKSWLRSSLSWKRCLLLNDHYTPAIEFSGSIGFHKKETPVKRLTKDISFLWFPSNSE